MLKYRNDGTKDQYLFGCGTVPVGQIASTPDGKYVTVFNKGDVWTIVDHAPSPWTTIHESILPVSVSSGLAKYSQIELINSTGGSITVVVNGDTANSRVIPDGQFRIIGQDREIDSLSVTGSSFSGAVYVYAL